MNSKTEIISSSLFLKRLKRLHKKFPSLKQDIAGLKAGLLANPRTGVDLGNGTYKIRLKITSKGKGKSGGARVISYVETELIGVVQNNRVILLTIYDKSEVDSISKEQIEALIAQMK
jgi:mRNA-degrading endonuclease RelE of RelBE toxin-antitoxin system